MVGILEGGKVSMFFFGWNFPPREGKQKTLQHNVIEQKSLLLVTDNLYLQDVGEKSPLLVQNDPNF